MPSWLVSSTNPTRQQEFGFTGNWEHQQTCIHMYEREYLLSHGGTRILKEIHKGTLWCTPFHTRQGYEADKFRGHARYSRQFSIVESRGERTEETSTCRLRNRRLSCLDSVLCTVDGYY